MPEKYKAVFLPLDDRILNLYKGYVLNGQMLTRKTEKNIYQIRYHKSNWFTKHFIKGQNREYKKRILKEEYKAVREEDVPSFINHCRKNHAKIFIYNSSPFPKVELIKLQKLKDAGFLNDFISINRPYVRWLENDGH